MITRLQNEIDQMWAQLEFENNLIAVYVPEADRMNRNEALALAYERDKAAAEMLRQDAENVNN